MDLSRFCKLFDEKSLKFYSGLRKNRISLDFYPILADFYDFLSWNCKLFEMINADSK
jgi:hypothetical protein